MDLSYNEKQKWAGPRREAGGKEPGGVEEREPQSEYIIEEKKQRLIKQQQRNPKIWVQVLCINTLVTSKIY